jgi:hypothetical protein
MIKTIMSITHNLSLLNLFPTNIRTVIPPMFRKMVGSTLGGNQMFFWRHIGWKTFIFFLAESGWFFESLSQRRRLRWIPRGDVKVQNVMIIIWKMKMFSFFARYRIRMKKLESKITNTYDLTF